MQLGGLSSALNPVWRYFAEYKYTIIVIITQTDRQTCNQKYTLLVEVIK